MLIRSLKCTLAPLRYAVRLGFAEKKEKRPAFMQEQQIRETLPAE